MGILIQNAKILLNSSQFKVSDVAISDEGIIESVGPRSTSGSRSTRRGPGTRHARPARAYERVDASGQVLLPGLVNTHTHAAMNLLRGVGDDLQLDAWLHSAIWPREGRMTEADVKIGSQLACAEMIRSGTTCFNDMYFHMDALAQVVRSSGLRAVLGYGMLDLGDFEGKGRRELAVTRAFAKRWHGRADGRIRVSIAPHAPNTCSPDLLRASAQLAQELDLPLHIHAAETRKELHHTLTNYKKRPLDHLDACGCLCARSILAHGVYASKSEVSLVAKRGASLAHCPVSNLKLAGGGAAPIPEYLAAGANVSLGTDGAASNNSLDLFESMKVGAIEQKNFRFDASAVQASDYLRAATLGGARALGLDAGEIAPGKTADLILIDARAPNLVPFSNNAGWLVYAAGPQNVTDVMVGGKWLMRERELLTLDEEKILRQAQKTAERLSAP